MGNKFTCSCTPLIRKAYRYEQTADSPWQTSRRRDGHLLRLWAEVFHVSASGAGTVKWQQVSEDLVPVNITCIQDNPECVFHITAYNSQVDKILDVRLVQPGTRIGQASECFVYWKDPMTNDTWGLNFTSPIDAKQFRECCSPSFKFSRKASSSYSLKLEPPSKQKVKTKRKPLSTPASPNRGTSRGEPQCTCMTADQYARLKAQDPRYRGSSTLPRAQTRSSTTDTETCRVDKVTAATSSTSLYDNVGGTAAQTPLNTSTVPTTANGTAVGSQRQTRDKGTQQQSQETSTMTSTAVTGPKTVTASVGIQNNVGVQQPSAVTSSSHTATTTDSKSEGTQAGGTLQSTAANTKTSATCTRPPLRDLHHHILANTKSVDYSEIDMVRESELQRTAHHHNVLNNNISRRSKSKSTEDMNRENGMSLDSNTLKRMLKPMPSVESPVTSPEMGRRRYYYNNHHNHNVSNQRYNNGGPRHHSSDMDGAGHPMHPPARSAMAQNSRFSGSRSSHEIGGRSGGGGSSGYPGRGLYLELDRSGGGGGGVPPGGDMSPPSDNVLFDNQCYATTPSSSNGNSDPETQGVHHYGAQQRGPRHGHHQNANNTPTPGSPTSRLLLEYEMHLRNTLAKGMDAESYSLHTFEALLTQSMENLGPTCNMNKSSTLPHRLNHCRQAQLQHSQQQLQQQQQQQQQLPLDRDGYYSDRNELLREREKERERERGYLSDHNASFSSKCASCIGESSRAQWFRHSDGWRSGSSAFGSGMGGANVVPTAGAGGPTAASTAGGHKRSPWDSLPSLRQDGSMNDSGYKSNRADSFEQRGGGMFDRQDSLRSDYMSDRESGGVRDRYGIVQQASVESADSRLCYLTSSEISDDDRMSLTTAVSDEDDGESAMNSPYKAKQTGSAAASFNCTGAVRKAGFLSVKKWLLRKKHQIELARKRGWKGYWVCLKGTTLLFYPCDSREGRSVEAAPKHLIIVDGAIMQPIPEHPKRDYIFCLSTAFGDAYLFQAPCQVELENWVNSIHSACAAAFARHRGKTGTLHLLQEEIFRLEKAIETDYKLKHMAEMQQSVVSDADARQQLGGQIIQWEENLERLHCEQFRLRCYMASLQSGELPNPKSLLTHVSRATKNTLNKLGVFTVSSFHAFICARSPSLLNNLLAGRGATKRRPPMLSRSNSGSSRRSMQMNSKDESENTVKVSLPDNCSATVYVRDVMSVEEFLASACGRKNLNSTEHFVRVKKRKDMEDHNYFVPHRSDLIATYLHTHEVVEVCAKILYQVELSRSTLEQMWGFSVEAELVENADRQDELCCYVSRVEDKSVAMQNGIIKSDEIMVINGAIVSDLDMMYLESVLQEELALCMMMRSSRTEPPEVIGGGGGSVCGISAMSAAAAAAAAIAAHASVHHQLHHSSRGATDDIIDSLVCPPPPSEPPVISEEMITGLIVPAPGTRDRYAIGDTIITDHHTTALPTDQSSQIKMTSRTNSFEIENLLKTAEQVTGFCRSPAETRKSSPTGSLISNNSQGLLVQAVVSTVVPPTTNRQLSDAEKIRKVILELIDTEKAYVKHLNNLLENYLEPLKKETFLSNAEINALFGNIQEIVTFQRQFLHNLEEALELEPDFPKFEFSSQFKNVLFSIGSAFLYYVNHFKLYSSFCASHSKAQKVLHPNEGNQALQEFLSARNPKQQHSSTLESYLIKPIQRILKYPLLLQQLRNLTDSNCDEHLHLVEALKGMEKVAEHINEMQRIHEEYGAIFDHLFRQHQKSCKQSIDLSPGDLLYYGGVEWLNISDFLGKIKKGLELHAMCFVFKSAVVFLCKERLRQKKKLMGVATKGTASEVEIIRYQVLIPVTEVQVRASSAKDMDSHFLWELIHLRSQLQRRSEKVYVLSNSTADFRNAFLKTIRQIIRESVRNMSIPSTKPGAGPGVLLATHNMAQQHLVSAHHTAMIVNSQTLERTHGGAVKAAMMVHGDGEQRAHTMGGKQTKRSKSSQRHSAGNIGDGYRDDPKDVSDDPPVHMQQVVGQGGGFRSRSKTVGDETGIREPPKPPKRSDVHHSESGNKSEGEEDASGLVVAKKCVLGKTPNHLTLRAPGKVNPRDSTGNQDSQVSESSTTSTLSAGSTGSQARLIQSSHQPENYHPIQMEELGKIKSSNDLPQIVHIVKNVPDTSSLTKHKSKRCTTTAATTTLLQQSQKHKRISPSRSQSQSPNNSRKSSPSVSSQNSRCHSPVAIVTTSCKTSPSVTRRSKIKVPIRSKSSESRTSGKSSSPIRLISTASSSIKSSLKRPAKSLSIDNPTCVECYLSGKSGSDHCEAGRSVIGGAPKRGRTTKRSRSGSEIHC